MHASDAQPAQGLCAGAEKIQERCTAMNEVIEKFGKIGIVPVIKIEDVEKAVPLAKALCEGGLPCAEVTFRTAQAEEAIRRITEAVPEMLVGAGTVLTTEQVDRAVGAGAKFIVSPGFNRKIVTYCIEKGVPVTPGCSSPSDVEQALECGQCAAPTPPSNSCPRAASVPRISMNTSLSRRSSPAAAAGW